MKSKTKESKDDNTLLVIVLSLLGLGGTIGAVAWARSRSDGGKSSSSSGSSKGAISGKSLPEVALAIREETLIVNGCTVSWRVGEASRTELLAHRDDFFVPAIADARAKGSTTVDEITAHLAALLVPGCAWPPTVLNDFQNLDDAVAGKLTFVEKQAWTIAQSMGSVRLYLTIRQVVAVLATQDRRG
ncbi:MAG TPA: hypothetical protein VK034_18405 [Enhygromyxa sp.]|nr:hypothetical protein [Enhygromyxa sp.]